MHAVPLVDDAHLVDLIAAELHVDQLGVVVHLSAESRDLGLEVLPEFLLFLQPLGVVTNLAGVEGGGDGTALGQAVDGGGSNCHCLWAELAVTMWVRAICLHSCENVSFIIVPEQLVRSEHAGLFLSIGSNNRACTMDSIELLALSAEEFFIQLGMSDWLVYVNWDLKSISDMLSGSETSEETAVLRGGVPWVAGVYHHASDVANGLVNLLESAIGEALSELSTDCFLVVEI